MLSLLVQAFCLWATVYGHDPDHLDIFWEPGLQVDNLFLEQLTPCPKEKNCSCWTNKTLTHAKTNVSCKNGNLKEVPTDLPNNTVFLDLSCNYIENLGSGRFEGYPSLETLILSQNSLTQIKQGAFTGLQKLKFLSLRNNSIRYNSSGFQPGIFKPFINLETLNIQQSFTRNDYRGENYDLKALTDLVKLKMLFLDGMPEHNLGQVFQNLTSLQEINFNGEYGRCLIWVMTPKFFPSNTSLTHISIQNCEMNKIQAKSFQSLTHLQYLDLSYNEELTFSCMKNLTDGLNSTKIETLKLKKLHGTFGPCITLTKENLKGLRYLALKEMYLDSNRIAYADDTAIKYVPQTLEMISMRDNILRMGNYAIKFLFNEISSNLQKIILADQFTNHYLDAYQQTNDIKLDKQLMTWTKRATKPSLLTGNDKLPPNGLKQDITGHTVKQLHASKNKQPMDIDKNVDLKMNETVQIRNDLKITKRHSSVHETDSLEREDGRSFLLKLKKNYEQENGNKFKNITRSDLKAIPIPCPKNLTYLDFSNNKIRLVLRNITLSAPNNLKKLNLSRNLYWAWFGPFLGFGNLTNLDMSWNFCNHMNLTVLKDMPKLEYLDFSRNYLDTSLNKDQNGIIFSNQGKLINLDISENKLRTLPANIFKGLKNLKHLDLSKNLLKHFEVNLYQINYLRTVSLSDNQLETINKSVRNVFDHQAYTSNLSFSLNLERNNFKCDCANLEFIKWMSVSSVKFENFRNYICYLKAGTHANLTFAASIYKTLEQKCTNYTPVIITSTAALVLFISLTTAAIVYRYRWNLRYLYYMTKYKTKALMLRHNNYELLGTEEDELKKVNVSYADEECGFVRQKIYTELEVSRGLKLHLRHRDSPVDEQYVCDNIMDAIESTEKTLIIMSKAYLKCKWSIFEMNMAGIKALKTELDMLCVLLLEEVPTEDLPLKIMKIIKDQEYIEYPGDDNLQDCFWDRLHDILTD